MSTKKVIVMTIAVLLTLEILSIAMLALFFPATRMGFVRSENYDQNMIDRVLAAKSQEELTDFENLIRLQLELDKIQTFTMIKESTIRAEQNKNNYTEQLVKDIKEKIGNTINYQSIQLKGQGNGLPHSFAPENAGTKVVFDAKNKLANVAKAIKVINNDYCVWNTNAVEYDETTYKHLYGNWGNSITDYFFDAENTIQNPDAKTITYDNSTKLYTLTVVANANATGHYTNKIMTLANNNIHQVNFKDSCAKLTFQFDNNWKINSYTIEEEYETITKIAFVSIKTKTSGTHVAKFFY